MSEQLWYYIDYTEAQQGPITIPQLQALVENGEVTPATVVWTEVLGEQWIPASNVEGLFPEDVPVTVDANTATVAVQAPHPMPDAATMAEEIAHAAAPPAPTLAAPTPAPALRAPGAAAQQPQQPQAAPTTPMLASTPTTQPIAGTAAAIPGVPAAAAAPVQAAGNNPYSAPSADPQHQSALYPATIQKGGNFMMWLMFIIVGVALLGFGIFSIFAGVSAAGESGDAATMQAAAGGGIGMILLFCGIGLLVASSILTYIYLYRAWAALQPGGATVSPGKAIGFLFIPIFSIYWIFIAFGGLPKQWKNITSSYENTKHAPQITFGMFMCLLFLPIIGAILWHKQIINAINFMASIGHTTGASTTFPQQTQQAESALGGVAGQSALGGAAPVAAAVAHPGTFDLADAANVTPIPAGTAPVAIKANPLMPSAPAAPAAAQPSPFAGVHAATKPNPLLAAGAAVAPQNRLNTTVPAKPAEPDPS